MNTSINENEEVFEHSATTNDSANSPCLDEETCKPRDVTYDNLHGKHVTSCTKRDNDPDEENFDIFDDLC